MDEITRRMKLKAAWDAGELVIFLGAGTSIPYGIPNWVELVAEMLFERNGGGDSLPAEYRTALGRWMRETSDFDAPALSRILKPERTDASSDAEYFDRLRKLLYGRRKRPDGVDDTLQTVARLLQFSERRRERETDAELPWNVDTVITTNFDDLLETELKKLGVKFKTHFREAGRTRTFTLPILHIHGFLPSPEVPLNDDLLAQKLVLAEDDYHRLAHDSFEWSNELMRYMNNYTILFIGCSMRDPNVRRLLDATKTNQRRTRHFLLRRNYAMPSGEELALTVKTLQERARSAGKASVSDGVVEAAIRKALMEAKTSDEEIFAQMDVGVLWFDSYAAIARYVESLKAYLSARII